jgi:DNA polymerase I-like protein with 3'-5' exonuclease and polymerase domains
MVMVGATVELDVVRSPQEASALLRQAHGAAGLDLETSGLRPYHDDVVVLSIAILHDKEGEHKDPQLIVLHWPGGTRTLPDDLACALEAADLVWYWHNGAAFDALFLAAAGVDVTRMRTVDTMINAKVLLGGVQVDLRKTGVSAGLDQELLRRLQIALPPTKKGKQREKWADKSALTQEDVDYCIADALYLPALATAHWEQATHRQRHAIRLEQEIARMLTQVSMRGLPVDRARMEAMEKEYRARMEGPAARLREMLPGCNPNYAVGMRERINAKYGLQLESVNRDSRLSAMLEHNSSIKSGQTKPKPMTITRQRGPQRSCSTPGTSPRTAAFTASSTAWARARRA